MDDFYRIGQEQGGGGITLFWTDCLGKIIITRVVRYIGAKVQC